jgi:hypothetical protein
MKQTQGQPFSFGFADSLLAEVGRVPQGLLHTDVEAICVAYEAVKPLAERLGVPAPVPRLAGFCYTHLAALGCEVVASEHAEPTVRPLIETTEQIDHLREPDDYLAAPTIRQRLRVCEQLRRRHPESPLSIGHRLEGPITTAAMVMGPAFLMLIYDDPVRAHRLLDFCVQSAINYAHTIGDHFGIRQRPGPVGFPDDLAGMLPPAMFPEFVLPYWERLYQALGATSRSLHSELLRVEHLPLLAEVRMEVYDPCADQYLTPELLAEHCPCRFTGAIHPWQLRDLSAKELEELYGHIANHSPVRIELFMERLSEEAKLHHLLALARQMQGN